MPYRRRLRAVAALGIVAAALLLVAPRVSADSDGNTRAVSGVLLVNNATRKPILGLSPLTDGSVVDLTRLANRKLSLRATTAAGVVPGSLAFWVTGAHGLTYSHTDSRAPYFLCGDYVDCPLLAAQEAYTLTVQAYTEAGATGLALGKPFSVRFSVSAAATPAAPVDVLFIGNSLVGTPSKATGENTPDLVRHLAALEGRAVEVADIIHFGHTLRQTWDDGLAAAALNGDRRYDYIVVQEYSTLVATSPSAATSTLLTLYGPAFARALKPGGRVVLFKNWALANPSPFRSRAAAKAAIDKNYALQSASLAAANLVAPIADEFETVIAAKGVRYLIDPDGKHPNDTAVYLEAVTLYGIFFQESPRDVADLYLTASAAAYVRSVAATAIGY